MTNQKTDRRIIKTKKAIHNAFTELLSQKDMNDITIKEIAQKADINRKTFYNYYNNIYELLNEIENDTIHNFEQAIEEFDFDNFMDSPSLFLEKLTLIINNDINFYSHFLTMEHNSNLMTKMSNSIKAKLKEALKDKTDMNEQQLNIMINYAVSGMIGIYQEWFQNHQKESLEDISKQTSVLVLLGIKGFITDKH
jgi:AcrR family transcriptional regulator